MSKSMPQSFAYAVEGFIFNWIWENYQLSSLSTLQQQLFLYATQLNYCWYQIFSPDWVCFPTSLFQFNSFLLLVYIYIILYSVYVLLSVCLYRTVGHIPHFFKPYSKIVLFLLEGRDYSLAFYALLQEESFSLPQNKQKNSHIYIYLKFYRVITHDNLLLACRQYFLLQQLMLKL